MLTGLRTAAGLTFAIAPERIGAFLVAGDARSGGARLLIRAFGARDALLGAGTWRALAAGGAARPWLLSCVLADVFDVGATLGLFRELPRLRRTLAFWVSLAPAVAGAWAARGLER